MRFWQSATLLLSVVLWLVVSGCVSAPVFRPAAPPLGSNHVEAAVGGTAMFGKTDMGAGTSAYVIGQVAPDIDVIAHGYGSNILKYNGSTPLASDVLFGGGIGMRGRYALFEHLHMGGEVLLEYGQRTGGSIDEQLITLVGGIPVAERAFDGVWVYTNIRVGLAIPLKSDPRGPFFGISEIPIGVAWEITPNLMLMGEGGVALPVQGGYGAVALALRL
jgi:hypothetical protein